MTVRAAGPTPRQSFCPNPGALNHTMLDDRLLCIFGTCRFVATGPCGDVWRNRHLVKPDRGQSQPLHHFTYSRPSEAWLDSLNNLARLNSSLADLFSI